MSRAKVFQWHGQTHQAGESIIQGAPASHAEAREGILVGAGTGLCCGGMLCSWLALTLATSFEVRPFGSKFTRAPCDYIPSLRHPVKSALGERSKQFPFFTSHFSAEAGGLAYTRVLLLPLTLSMLEVVDMGVCVITTGYMYNNAQPLSVAAG